jgi:hypothetical protein
MAKLVVLLALAQSALIHGLPAREPQHDAQVVDERAITLSSDVAITTSYSRVVSTLQSLSVTESPSITGVGSLRRSYRDPTDQFTGHTDRFTRSRLHIKSH